MISEATAIHTAYPEYLGRDVRRSILYEGINPFQSDYFTIVQHPSVRQEIIDGKPCIIMATSGMLEGGPVIEYFKSLAEDEKNTIIFVSYQIEGTMGRRVQKGMSDVTMINSNGRLGVVKVRLQVESIEGFSGHSDRHQIINYITHLNPKPERVVVCHGEKSKCLNLANFIQRRLRIQALVPVTMETFRLL
ncbi:beta-CASP ribonuclease aCPSF1, partial [Candidatus Bathyarchaeota archaeon]|nr:beta-CASP ribonuclease aCPSF1 [Candidatus Bathyarchaeota archaeon]